MRMGLVAAALAVLAFVIAGHFLGGDDGARADLVDPDAGLPAAIVDAAPAAPTIDASAAAKPPPKRVRKKRPRRKRRKPKKKNRRK